MSDNIGTLSEDGLGMSSSPDQPHIDPDSTNIIGTVGDLDDAAADTPSEETLTTDEGGEAGKETSGEDKVAGDGKPLPFHKHPDWQRILTERDEAKKEAEAIKAEIAALKTVREEVPQGPRYNGPAYVDITTKTNEELAEWQQEDPKGYAANLYAQIKAENWHEQQREMGQKNAQERIRSTFDDYRGKNPDFDKMWQSGEIPKFMQANPGHNAISAHQMLTMEARIKEATDKAAKEAEAKVIANQKAKRSAQVLGGGPAVTGGGKSEDAAINDTKSHGGKISVIARNIIEMRKGRGG
jgi:hypothetical protein